MSRHGKSRDVHYQRTFPYCRDDVEREIYQMLGRRSWLTEWYCKKGIVEWSGPAGRPMRDLRRAIDEIISDAGPVCLWTRCQCPA